MQIKKKYIFIFILLFITICAIGACIISFNMNKIKSEPGMTGNETPKEIPSDEHTANLTIVGDFLYEEPYYNALKVGEDESRYFSRIKHYFQEDDLSIGNMEVVIGNANLKSSGTGFSFCAPQTTGKQVVDLGMDVLSTANNHSNDRGLEGRLSTLDFFKDNSDILTVGTYRNGERNVLNNIREVNEIKFGFLAYTYGTNVKIEESLREGIGLINDPDNVDHQKYIDKMSEEIKTLREEVDVLIVIMHWGVEFTYSPNESQRNLANLLNSLGVDIVVGSHSHSIEPIEWINSDKHDTLVYYSLGNFVSADDDISRTGETFDNAYQFGLLSTLKVLKDKNGVYIKDVKAEPVINYYDSSMKNFLLVPYDEYGEDLEKSHFRYKYNFNKKFIDNAFTAVIKEDFR